MKPLNSKNIFTDESLLDLYNRKSQGREDFFKLLLKEEITNYPAITLGETFIPEMQTTVPVKLTESCREIHTYIIGKNGQGKTILLKVIIIQDMELGRGLVVISPETDLVEDYILPNIPKNRIDDVIYFNPKNHQKCLGFNPLHIFPEEMGRIQEKADELFQIIKLIVGGRDSDTHINSLLRHTIRAMVEAPNTTLKDIERFYLDKNYRDTLILPYVKHERTRHYFSSDQFISELKSGTPQKILTQLENLLGDEYFERMFCMRDGGINLFKAMNENKIILFNIGDSNIGKKSSELLGKIIINQINMITIARADIEREKRNPCPVYVDEFQVFINTASKKNVEDMLARARKYKVPMILAHQYRSQMPASILDAVGNAGTIIAFLPVQEDHAKVAKYFDIEPEDIKKLRQFEAYCKINQSSFKMNTPKYDVYPGNKEWAEKVKQRSIELYGSEPEEKLTISNYVSSFPDDFDPTE